MDIVVGDVRAVAGAAWPQVSAAVTSEGCHELFFRASQGPLARDSAVFLFAALGAASKLAARLCIQEPVAPGALDLARSLNANAAAWITRWFDAYHPIEIVAPAAPGAPPTMPDRRGVACFFSGGVDSFDTLLRHQQEITHLVYVHGFDTPLTDTQMRAQILQALRRAAAELGKPLVEVETNLRQVLHPWGHPVATFAQAGIACLLAPQFRRVYVASDYAGYWPDDCPPQQTAQAATVDLDSVQIVFDGRDRPRSAKIDDLATSAIAMRWLRVCWSNRNMAYNCGECEKCLRTMCALHISGALQRCSTFAHSISPGAIRRMTVQENELPYWREILPGLERQRDDTLAGELAAAVRERLAHPTPLPGSSAAALARAEARIIKLEEELHELKASRSWQLTAPLRAAGTIVRRARRQRRV